MLHSDFSVYTGNNYELTTWILGKQINAVYQKLLYPSSFLKMFIKNHSRHQNCKYVKFTTNIHSVQASQWHSFKCRITSR